MAIRKSIDNISEADLADLIVQEVREDRGLDCKRELNISPEARAEFFRDISSFANALGGDIIYGLDEEGGVAKAPIRALSSFDADRTPLQLRDLCQHHIDPPIHGIQFQPVSLGSGGHAMVIRIPQTWNRPHMVTYENENRFWRRDGGGKRFMTTTGIREALVLSSSTVDRIRLFRLDQLDKIRKGETPAPLKGNVYVVVHVLPLMSFEASNLLDMQQVYPTANAFLQPIAWERYGGMNKTFNLEGILATSVGRTEQVLSYVQLFRNGCLEAVDSCLLQNHPKGSILNPEFERQLGNALPQYLNGLEKYGIHPPIFLAISLLNVRGFVLPDIPGQVGVGRMGPAFRQADIVLPEIQIDAVEESYFSALKPSYDIIWQAGEQRGDPNYDAAGSWNYLWI